MTRRVHRDNGSNSRGRARRSATASRRSSAPSDQKQPDRHVAGHILVRAVLVSAGVHVALIAAFAGWHIARPERVVEDGPAAPVLQSIENIDIVPMDVALVTLPAETGGDGENARPALGARKIVAATTGRAGTGT